MTASTRWDIVDNAIVIRNIRLANGTEVDAIIEKPGVEVPADFQFASDNLLELRDKCASVASQLADPFRMRVLFSESEGICCARSLEGCGTDYRQNRQMVTDCQRISALTGSYLTAMAAPSALSFAPPTTVHRPLPAPSAPPLKAPQIDELIRLLDTVLYGTERFSAVRETAVTSKHKQDLLKLAANPEDSSAREMKRWLCQLTQKAFDEYFTDERLRDSTVRSGETRPQRRARLSAEFVIALLLKDQRVAIGPLTEAIASAVLGNQNSCTVM